MALIGRIGRFRELTPPGSSFPLALVTGAAHRLGRSFALHLARLGYAVALHYNTSATQSAQVADEISALGVPVFRLQADLRDEESILSMFRAIDTLQADPDPRVSDLAVLVNSAAVMPRGDARIVSVAEFDSTLSLNLRAPFLCAQYAYQRMVSGGLIVNISDVAAQKTWTGFPAYTISKAGLDSLTRILARSFAPLVRVNGIAPGLVLASENVPPEEWQRLLERLPLQRSALLDEIVVALEFLLKNEYITGQTIIVDGGYSLI